MNVVLISTYELGRQPFGLASPAAWLRARGHEVACLDLSREGLAEEAIREADLIAFHVPMHTATRLAVDLLEPVRRIQPRAAVCFYGLYAPVNEGFLRGMGVDAILGGEFEQGLADLADRLAGSSGEGPKGVAFEPGGECASERGDRQVAPTGEVEKGGAAACGGEAGRLAGIRVRYGQAVAGGGDRPVAPTGGVRESGGEWVARRQAEEVISLGRQEFLVPDRAGLVGLERYARLSLPDGRQAIVGSTEASRGCKHRCRHCPVVPVYNGVFRVVQPEIVMEDIRRQVAAGAGHITFGDPDFLNGPRHALGIVRKLHEKFPRLTYDVTIKVEHLLKHRAELGTLRETGCLFVTSAVESLDDEVLERLEKGHTRADFIDVVGLCREAGLTLQPTFIPFTPWTTLESYGDLLETLERLDLVGNVAPVQLSIRLLVPAGSRLLELEDFREMVGPFDEPSLVYPWRHPDERVDRLQREIEELVKGSQARGLSRGETFEKIREAAQRAQGEAGAARRPAERALVARAAIPYLTEPWYC